MSKIHKSVVRNQAYRAAEFGIRERHNERKNECYFNGDIERKRFHLNVHFKKCEGTYEETFNKMKDDGVISTRGQKAEAKVFDELVYDVNTEYFENKGGYDYAKSFFESAYNQAVKEVGGEEFILFAIMHADERNKALSEKLGYDVYHYHLHVVYVPVVEKQVKWSKRCKDPALVGTVKEVIKQVSHSKKWARGKGADGKWFNSYSALQDRFHDHMKQAGFEGFERGELGSTTEHLTVVDYKTKKEKERLTELQGETAKESEELTALKTKTEIKKVQADKIEEIDGAAQKGVFGKFTLTADNWAWVSALAKEGFKSRNIIKNLKSKVKRLEDNIKALGTKIAGLEKQLSVYQEGGITELMEFTMAKQRHPELLRKFLREVKILPTERELELKRQKRLGLIQKYKGEEL